MNTEYLRILEDYRQEKLSVFEEGIIELMRKAPSFELGKLALIYPEHYRAYKLLDLERITQ